MCTCAHINPEKNEAEASTDADVEIVTEDDHVIRKDSDVSTVVGADASA